MKRDVCGPLGSVDCVCIAGSIQFNKQGVHGRRRERVPCQWFISAGLGRKVFGARQRRKIT